MSLKSYFYSKNSNFEIFVNGATYLHSGGYSPHEYDVIYGCSVVDDEW